MRPSLAAGIPNRALGPAVRRSQAMASWVPAPSAAPSTAAIVGKGASCNACSTDRSVAPKAASSTPVRSAPAQKCPPAPVSTSTRVSEPDATAAAIACSSPNSASRSTALRRCGRSIVTNATAPRCSVWITSLDDRDQVAFLHLIVGRHRQLRHRACEWRDDGDLHLHRFEDHELVADVDALPELDPHLPHVGRDLRSHLGHGATLASFG